MKALLFIFLGFSFFIIHCSPLEEEEGASQLDDVFSGDLNSEAADSLDTEAETRDEDSEDVETEDQVADITEELGDSEPRFIREDKGFYADDFEHREFYGCVKEIGKNYYYELYEEPDDSPYVCYLIHRYKNCGKSYSDEKGYCYHNAVKQKGYCRAQLERNLAKRRGQGYVCGPMEKPVQEEDSAGSDDQQDAADSESQQQPTAASETESADDVVEEGAATEGTEAADDSGDEADEGTVEDSEDESDDEEGTAEETEAESDDWESGTTSDNDEEEEEEPTEKLTF